MMKDLIFLDFGKIRVKILVHCIELEIQSRFYPGDLVTRAGDREIRSVSGRLPDNPGELA